MNARTVRAAYSGLVLGYVVAVAGAILARDYWRERTRQREVVTATKRRLNELFGSAIQRDAVRADLRAEEGIAETETTDA